MGTNASAACGAVRRRRIALVLGSAWALALPAIAQAQAVPAPPSREELNVGQPTAQGEANRQRLSVEGDIERGPCPLADPGFADTRVTFSTVSFAGLPDVPARALDSAWREYAGRELPIATLCEVRDRAATILRDMGFLAAVQVPPQRIEPNGIVQMDVLAAKLVEVQLRGEPGPSERLIAAHLAKLTRQPWFNSQEAERHLLLLGDLPGYNVRLILRSADAAPGEVIGDVVLERTPVELIVGTQNLGPPATGREGAFAALSLNDLIGFGDRTTFSYYQTYDWDEQRIFRVVHDLAVSTDGLRLGGSVLWAQSRPDVGADFRTETLSADVGLTYPLVRRQAESLMGGVGLEIAYQKLKLGTTPLSEDQLTVVHARLDYQATDPASVRGYRGFTVAEPRWSSDVSLELRQGIDALGASQPCVPLTACLPPNRPISNLLADPTAFVARLRGNLSFVPFALSPWR